MSTTATYSATYSPIKTAMQAACLEGQPFKNWSHQMTAAAIQNGEIGISYFLQNIYEEVFNMMLSCSSEKNNIPGVVALKFAAVSFKEKGWDAMRRKYHTQLNFLATYKPEPEEAFYFQMMKAYYCKRIMEEAGV